jgi:hypothetical protein
MDYNFGSIPLPYLIMWMVLGVMGMGKHYLEF